MYNYVCYVSCNFSHKINAHKSDQIIEVHNQHTCTFFMENVWTCVMLCYFSHTQISLGCRSECQRWLELPDFPARIEDAYMSFCLELADGRIKYRARVCCDGKGLNVYLAYNNVLKDIWFFGDINIIKEEIPWNRGMPYHLVECLWYDVDNHSLNIWCISPKSSSHWIPMRYTIVHFWKQNIQI